MRKQDDANAMAGPAHPGHGSALPGMLPGVFPGAGAGALRGWPTGHRRALLAAGGLVLGWAVFNLFHSLGDHPVYLAEEAAAIATTRAMIESGDWLMPHVGEGAGSRVAWPVAPWLRGVAMVVLGPTAFAARLPGALGCVAAASAGWWFMRRQRDAIAAVIAAALMLVMPLTLATGRAATTDAALAAWWAWALVLGFAGWAGRPENAKPSAAVCAGFWVAVAVGVLTRGAIGALPAAVVGLTLLASGRGRLLLHWSFWAGLVFASLPVAGWVWAVMRRGEAIDWFGAVEASALSMGWLPMIALLGGLPATAFLPWRTIAAMRDDAAVFFATAGAFGLAAAAMLPGGTGFTAIVAALPAACLAADALRDWLEVTDDSWPIDRDHSGRRLPNGTWLTAALATLAVVGAAIAVGRSDFRAALGIDDRRDALLLKLVMQSMLTPALLWAAAVMWRRTDRRPWAMALIGLAFAALGLFAATIENAATMPLDQVDAVAPIQP